MQDAAAAGSVSRSRLPGSAEARRHVPTDVAERAAAALAAGMPGELALVSPPEAALVLARRLLGDLAFHYGFDRMAPLLTRDGIYDAPELQSLLTEVLASDQVSKLAKRLLNRPDGVGLRAPSRSRPPVAAENLLTELLTWLTDDSWSLEFCQLPEGAGPLDESQGFLFDTVPGDSVPVLFSGGLDSAAGLAAHLLSGNAVAISVDTNNWMQHVQARVLSDLQALSVHQCVPLRYRVSVGRSSVETSQRSRGMLFLAVGIATAWALRQDRLRVFENGIGAINLPYLRSQFGSQATRSMHPRTLRLMKQLAAAVSSRPFHLEAPALKTTKAQLIEMVPAVAEPALALTVSCDTGFSARVRDHAPCGACTSCLLRRQALHAAGKADLDKADAYRDSSPVRSVALQAMLWQVARIRACLDQADPWTTLVSEFPEILDTAPLAPADVTSLYRSYIREWDSIQSSFPVSSQLGRQGKAAL
jgi:7-cyano-7-deazaguanine synthase in queuosine biosynthesis